MARKGTVDASTEPPRIVFEESAACRDTGRTEALLRETLAAARAPGAGWRVTMRINGGDARERPSRGLRAEGSIVDERGSLVAKRELAGAAGDCKGLARAVGLWASIVLDQAVTRTSPPDAPASAGGDGRHGTEATQAGAVDAGSGATAASASAADAEAPTRAEWAAARDAAETNTAARATRSQNDPPPDASFRRDANNAFEVGLATFVMTGDNGTNAILGAAPYAVIEAKPGFFLRPSAVVGESLADIGDTETDHALLMAIRLDACTRFPGNYTTSRGLELTACGGADFGTMYFADGTLLPQVSPGPSLDLRGEIGRWSIVLRGVGGVNVVRNGFTDKAGNHVGPDWVSGRLELALAWRVR
jgi:hypothetical protein